MRPQSDPLEGVAPTVQPFRAWQVLAIGMVVGLMAGMLTYVLQVSIDPDIARQPIGQFRWVVLYNILSWTSWFALVPLVWRLSTLVRISRERWVFPVAFHLAGSIVFAAGHSLLAGTIQYWLLVVSGQPSSPLSPITWGSRVSRVYLYNFEWEVLLYWGIVGMTHALAFHSELQWRALRESRLQARLVEARLESLQRQLHPHFVFNTLNAVATLLHRDPAAAESMIVRLGELLRAVFRSDVQQEVPLARELALTEQYLDIQRLRFGTRLRFDVNLPPEAETALVPVLILQPLVENAIKHGFAGTTEGGVIRLTGEHIGDQLVLTVADTGRGLDGREPSAVVEGVGLSNTRARLEHLYPGRHGLEIDAPPGGGFSVTLRLPWRTADQAPEIAEILDIPA